MWSAPAKTATLDIGGDESVHVVDSRLVSEGLRKLLGEDVRVDGLDDEDAARLAAIVRDAVQRQSDALDRGIDDGLRSLPKLLRGPVKKVLFR